MPFVIVVVVAMLLIIGAALGSALGPVGWAGFAIVLGFLVLLGVVFYGRAMFRSDDLSHAGDSTHGEGPRSRAQWRDSDTSHQPAAVDNPKA